MNSILLYDVPHKEAFGAYVALYIFFTGLSAGSFFLSTLAYGFGLKQYRALSRPGIVTAFLMLVIAPIFLGLLHMGQPFRFWHTLVFLNPSSPISWGTFLLFSYPLFCLLYAFVIFTDRVEIARIVGLAGIPFAVSVHAYTGFILAFCSSRPMWNSSMIPVLFLVSAVVSGTALMILVYAGWCRCKGEAIDASHENGRLLFSLSRILAWVLLLDLLMTGIEILTASVSGSETRWGVRELLVGELALDFVGIEIVLGKLVPLIILFVPRFRKIWTLLLASVLIIVGILFMRLDLIRVGELMPLL